MSESKLFTPLKVGAVTVPNRVFMAPLTRLRSIEPGDIPTRAHRACTARSRLPLGKKSPPAYTPKTGVLPFSCGTPGAFPTAAFSRVAPRRLRHRPLARAPVPRCVMKTATLFA